MWNLKKLISFVQTKRGFNIVIKMPGLHVRVSRFDFWFQPLTAASHQCRCWDTTVMFQGTESYNLDGRCSFFFLSPALTLAPLLGRNCRHLRKEAVVSGFMLSLTPPAPFFFPTCFFYVSTSQIKRKK